MLADTGKTAYQMSKTVDDSGDQPGEEDNKLEEIQKNCPYCDGTGIVNLTEYDECACNWGY